MVGIKVVGECLGLAQRTETQECAQYLLHQLSIVCYNISIDSIAILGRATLGIRARLTKH